MKFILPIIMASLFIYPSGRNLNKEMIDLQVQSNNYLVYSVVSEEIIAYKNHDVLLSGASINKVLTVLTALDYIDDEMLDEVFEVDPKIFDDVAIEASVAGFYPNQEVTLRDVLYGVMLPSGADAAILLSYKLFDSADGIVEAMNIKAKALGMRDTTIKNPVGLDENGQHTSLNDLLILLLEALEDDVFYAIYTSREYKLSQEDAMFFDGILVQAVDYENAHLIGAKSGYTLEAKRALSSLADNGDLQYIVISTQADGGYYEDNGALDDAISIYEYLFSNYQKRVLVERNKEVGSLKVKYHYDDIPLIITDDFEGISNDNLDLEDVEIKVYKEEGLKAPLEKGSLLAKYEIIINDVKYHEQNIYLEEDLEADYIDQMIIVIPIILVLSGAGIIVFIIKRRKDNA